MLFGTRDDFAIECRRHDLPLSEEQRTRGWVFGYLCVWVAGQRLGGINDWNMLNPVEAHFQDLTDEWLELLTDEAVDHLSNDQAVKLLNAALYEDDSRTDEQVYADAQRFRKFDFLLNWGEMFDHPPVKALLLRSDEASLRVLYQIGSDPIAGATVSARSFKEAVGGFLRWMNEMRTALIGCDRGRRNERRVYRNRSIRRRGRGIRRCRGSMHRRNTAPLPQLPEVRIVHRMMRAVRKVTPWSE